MWFNIVYVHIWLNICTFVYVYIWLNICTFVYLYVHIHVCMHICMFTGPVGLMVEFKLNWGTHMIKYTYD
jgi:hypothetical protein